MSGKGRNGMSKKEQEKREKMGIVRRSRRRGKKWG
jgi:hypothetical protein